MVIEIGARFSQCSHEYRVTRVARALWKNWKDGRKRGVERDGRRCAGGDAVSGREKSRGATWMLRGWRKIGEISRCS